MAGFRAGASLISRVGVVVTSAAAPIRSKSTVPASSGVVCTFLSHGMDGLDRFQDVMQSLGLECRRSEAETDSGMQVVTVEALTSTGTLEVAHVHKLSSFLLNKRDDRATRLLAVTLGPDPTSWMQCMPGTHGIAHSKAAPSGFVSSVSSGLKWNRFASGIGCEPCIIAPELNSQPSPHNEASPESPAAGAMSESDGRPTLKEIVLGGSTVEAVSSCEAALRASQWHRNKRSLAVWQAQAEESYAAVRVLPSKHSAAVLHVEDLDAVAEQLRNVAGLTCSLHGVKAGAPLSGRGSGGEQHHGQLALAVEALPGLDIRLTPSATLEPYWAESDAASNEDVDVALNPPADSPLARASLSCGSVVGRQVLSGVKGRLAFLKDI